MGREGKGVTCLKFSTTWSWTFLDAGRDFLPSSPPVLCSPPSPMPCLLHHIAAVTERVMTVATIRSLRYHSLSYMTFGLSIDVLQLLNSSAMKVWAQHADTGNSFHHSLISYSFLPSASALPAHPVPCTIKEGQCTPKKKVNIFFRLPEMLHI